MAKELYTVRDALWHAGKFYAAGDSIELHAAQAKYLAVNPIIAAPVVAEPVVVDTFDIAADPVPTSPVEELPVEEPVKPHKSRRKAADHGDEH